MPLAGFPLVIGALISSAYLSSLPTLSRADDTPTPCGDHQIGYSLANTNTPFSALSPNWPGRRYFVQPCQSVDSSLCPQSTNQQQCFTASNSSAASGLGSASSSFWVPLNFDWEKGAVSLNVDSSNLSREKGLFNETESLCRVGDAPLDDSICDVTRTVSFGDNGEQTCWAVTIDYLCKAGTNQMSILNEPKSQSDTCVWHFEVDSSVICATRNQSWSPNGTSPSGSQLPPIIWLTLLLPIISIIAVLGLMAFCWVKNVRRSELQQEAAEQASQFRALQAAFTEPLFNIYRSNDNPSLSTAGGSESSHSSDS